MTISCFKYKFIFSTENMWKYCSYICWFLIKVWFNLTVCWNISMYKPMLFSALVSQRHTFIRIWCSQDMQCIDGVSLINHDFEPFSQNLHSEKGDETMRCYHSIQYSSQYRMICIVSLLLQPNEYVRLVCNNVILIQFFITILNLKNWSIFSCGISESSRKHGKTTFVLANFAWQIWVEQWLL